MNVQKRKLSLIKKILEIEDSILLNRLEKMIAKGTLLTDDFDRDVEIFMTSSEPNEFKVINAEELREFARKWG